LLAEGGDVENGPARRGGQYSGERVVAALQRGQQHQGGGAVAVVQRFLRAAPHLGQGAQQHRGPAAPLGDVQPQRLHPAKLYFLGARGQRLGGGGRGQGAAHSAALLLEHPDPGQVQQHVSGEFGGVVLVFVDDRVGVGGEAAAHRPEVPFGFGGGDRDQGAGGQHGVALVVLLLRRDHVAEQVVVEVPVGAS